MLLNWLSADCRRNFCWTTACIGWCLLLLSSRPHPIFAEQIQLSAVFAHQDYPVDTLRRLISLRAVPDTSRVFYLNQLASKIGQTNLLQATDYAKQAIELAQQIKYPRGALNGLRVLGNIAAEQGDYVTALRAYQQALTIARELKDRGQLFPLYLCMGRISAAIGDNERSLQFLLRGHSLLKELWPRITPECQKDYAASYIALGSTSFQLRDFEQAKIYARKTMRLYDRNSLSPFAAKANLLMGRIYRADESEQASRLDSAAFFLQAALYIDAVKGNEKEIAGNLIQLAELYQQQNKYPDMYNMAQRSLAMARKIGAKPYQQTAATLVAAAAAALGNYEEAYAYQLQSGRLSQGIIGVEKTRALQQLEVRFDVQAQKQRIELLTQHARLTAAESSEQTRLFWLLLLFTSLLGLGLVAVSRLVVRLRKSQHELATANGEISLANEEISQSAAEKEVLVQEIHHRVKNNLQLISSLLAWQKQTQTDPVLAQVLAGNQARIQSMAMVHEFLYQADNLASVRLDTYLRALLDSLRSSLTSPGKDITLQTNLSPLLMDAKDAGYFGLLVNEVVTNAYKHAFSDQAIGHLKVELVTLGTGFSLVISDDGKGLPQTGFTSRPDSIGVELVKTLTKQLKATLSVKQMLNGTHIEITRPY